MDTQASYPHSDYIMQKQFNFCLKKLNDASGLYEKQTDFILPLPFLLSTLIRLLMCWANKLFFIMVFLLAVTSFLAGCGNKGKLYLPDHKKQDSAQVLKKAS